jgi:hypothetical protein
MVKNGKTLSNSVSIDKNDAERRKSAVKSAKNIRGNLFFIRGLRSLHH